MARIRIRTFAKRDRPALRALFVASRNAAFTWAAPGTHRLEDLDTVTAGEIVLVALIDHEPVGFASIWEPDSFLHNLFVHPTCQRRGVGRALLAACAPYFRSTATLKCLKRNRAAMRFYRAHGWSVRGEGKGAGGAYFVLEQGTVVGR
jgi:GNAT superfamily N-acetyltransferase